MENLLYFTKIAAWLYLTVGIVVFILALGLIAAVV